MQKYNNTDNQNIEIFAAYAEEYCLLLENASQFRLKAIVHKLLELLPKLYSGAFSMNTFHSHDDMLIQQVVTEQAWQTVKDILRTCFGRYDTYSEVFDSRNDSVDDDLICSISEDLADIYQDLKNFSSLFSVAAEDELHALVNECRSNFEAYWGQQLVNVQRALHNLYFGPEDLDAHGKHKTIPDNDAYLPLN